MRYGLPYKGSKNKIALPIVEFISKRHPDADMFVDLMAGGCSVSHCAMLNSHFRNFIINDISDSVDLFIGCLGGKYDNEYRWISRAKFNANVKSFSPDPYIKFAWSFGNNGRSYLYSKEKEKKAEALHRLIINSDPAGSREYLSSDRIKLILSAKTVKERRLLLGAKDNRLEHLERLERIKSIKAPGDVDVHCFNLSYKDVLIPEDSVVYIDPPYRGTDGYGVKFNHNDFWAWVREQPFPMYISEYSAPKDFEPVWSMSKSELLSVTGLWGPGTRTEHLYYWGGK